MFQARVGTSMNPVNNSGSSAPSAAAAAAVVSNPSPPPVALPACRANKTQLLGNGTGPSPRTD